MVPARVMIICWAYHKLLVITRTDKLPLVPSNYLSVAGCVTSLTSFFSFHVKKISQILESLARKWNTLEQNGLAMVATWPNQRESITHNSNFCWRAPAVRVIQVSLYYPTGKPSLVND